MAEEQLSETVGTRTWIRREWRIQGRQRWKARSAAPVMRSELDRMTDAALTEEALHALPSHGCDRLLSSRCSRRGQSYPPAMMHD